jgi:hypothetical protein
MDIQLDYLPATMLRASGTDPHLLSLCARAPRVLARKAFLMRSNVPRGVTDHLGGSPGCFGNSGMRDKPSS